MQIQESASNVGVDKAEKSLGQHLKTPYLDLFRGDSDCTAACVAICKIQHAGPGLSKEPTAQSGIGVSTSTFSIELWKNIFLVGPPVPFLYLGSCLQVIHAFGYSFHLSRGRLVQGQHIGQPSRSWPSTYQSRWTALVARKFHTVKPPTWMASALSNHIKL